MPTFTPPIKGIIFDMDGVLWREDTPLADLPALFKRLDQHGIRYAFATNNATRSVEMYIQKFLTFGVQVEPQQIITSAMATAYLLKKHFPAGGPVYVAGEKGLINTLADAGFHHNEDNVLAVVAGLDRSLNYEKLSKATLLINNGAMFVGTNPDPSYPTPLGLQPGAGAMIGFISIATGVTPQYAGKPAPVMVNMALEHLKLTPQEVLVVGDRLDTDILTGQNAGCRTGLVLSGVTSRQDLETWPQAPDLVCDHVSELIATLLED